MGIITQGRVPSTPQKPSSGKDQLYPKSDGWYTQDDSGIESKVFSPPNPYGQNYVGDSITGESTNTTNTMITYLRIAYPAGLAIAGRKYEIQLTSLTRYSSTGRNHMTRVALDGTQLGELISVEPKDGGADIRVPANYNYIVDGSQLNNLGGFIDHDFRAQQNGDTARVYASTLTFKRVL